MPQYPFPTNLSRVFDASAVEIIQRNEQGHPTAVCVLTQTAGDRAIALALLKEHPTSFVLFEDARSWPDGQVCPCDPSCPASLAELRQAFDVEIVTREWPGPRTRVYVFTHSQQEWDDAKVAVRHLLDQKLLSPRSYIEGCHTGTDQGISARHLDAEPHSAGLVALFREAAYCIQNDLYERDTDTADWDDEDEDLDRDDDWDDEDEDLDRDDDRWNDDDEANDEKEGEGLPKEEAERRENHREGAVISALSRQRMTTRLTRPLGF